MTETVKRTKASVDYSVGMMKTHCGNCDHYIRPNACERVIGLIKTNYWCKLWTKRKADWQERQQQR